MSSEVPEGTGAGVQALHLPPTFDGAGFGFAQALLRHLAARAAALEAVPVLELADTLGRAGERIADPGHPLHAAALEALVSETGLSRPQASWTLRGMARDWSPVALRQLLERELPDPVALDHFVPAPLPEWPGRRRRARVVGRAGGVGVHIGSGNVPGVSLTSLIRGCLVKAPVLLKPGMGDRATSQFFMQALRHLAAVDGDPVAAAIVEATAVISWRGGQEPELESALLSDAGHVVVYGDDLTIERVRARLGASVPFVGYPHRIGVAVLAGAPDDKLARGVAEAVAAFDQRGCVSLQQAFCLGPFDEAERWGERVAGQLARIDRERPPGIRSPQESSSVHQMRTTLELRELGGEPVRLWSAQDSGWTVILDTPDAPAQLCAGRTLRIVPCETVADLERSLRGFGGRIQVAGIARSAIENPGEATTDTNTRTIFEALAAAGAGRIVQIGRMPFPGPGWMHDGQGALMRLLRWTDCEGP